MIVISGGITLFFVLEAGSLSVKEVFSLDFVQPTMKTVQTRSVIRRIIARRSLGQTYDVGQGSLHIRL